MVNLVQAFSVATKVSFSIDVSEMGMRTDKCFIQHMLRGEPGVYYEDLYPLICFLPRYSIHPPLTHGDDDSEYLSQSSARCYFFTSVLVLPLWRASEMVADSDAPPPTPVTHVQDAEMQVRRTTSAPTGNGNSTSENRRKSWINSLNSRNKSKNTDDFDPEKVLPTVQCERPLRPARNPPEASAYDYLPILRIFKPLISLVVRGKMSSMSEGGKRTLSGKKKYVAVESNVPLEISLFLSSYFAWLLKNGFLTPVN